MIEITAIYFVWLLRIFQPYLILPIENLLNTKPLLNLPIVNRYTPFRVIRFLHLTIYPLHDSYFSLGLGRRHLSQPFVFTRNLPLLPIK